MTNVEATSIYGEIAGKKFFLLLLIASAIVLTVIVDVMTGPAPLSFGEVVSTILSPSSNDQSFYAIV